MVSGITPFARECKWTVYFGEPPKYWGSRAAITSYRLSDRIGEILGVKKR